MLSDEGYESSKVSLHYGRVVVLIIKEVLLQNVSEEGEVGGRVLGGGRGMGNTHISNLKSSLQTLKHPLWV